MRKNYHSTLKDIAAFFKRHPGIPVGVIATCVAIALLLQVYTISQLTADVNEQRHTTNLTNQIVKRVEENSEGRKAQLNQLQSHVDCIFLLFSQPNHGTLSITNLTGCKLTSSNSYVQPDTSPPAQNAVPEYQQTPN